jgi:hypothetical protein
MAYCPIILFLICSTFALQGQDIEVRLYSEFQRIDASGEVIAADRGGSSQEIISPALVRNGFTTFHVAVTARPRVLYWFAIQTNPPEIFRIKLYKEQFLEQGRSFIPDGLVEQPNPLYFLGVMPDVPAPRVTQVYLLDIWTPADTTAGRVRFEVLAKTAYWTVAPMEVRVLPVRVPDPETAPACCFALPSPVSPASSSVWDPLFHALTGGFAPLAPAPGTVRSVILRNALQDAAIVRTLDPSVRDALLHRMWPIMAGTLLPMPASIRPTAQSYFPLRQAIYRAASDRITGRRE